MVKVLHCNRNGEKFEKFGVSPGSAFPRDIFYSKSSGRSRVKQIKHLDLVAFK